MVYTRGQYLQLLDFSNAQENPWGRGRRGGDGRAFSRPGCSWHWNPQPPVPNPLRSVPPEAASGRRRRAWPATSPAWSPPARRRGTGGSSGSPPAPGPSPSGGGGGVDGPMGRGLGHASQHGSCRRWLHGCTTATAAPGTARRRRTSLPPPPLGVTQAACATSSEHSDGNNLSVR